MKLMNKKIKWPEKENWSSRQEYLGNKIGETGELREGSEKIK